MRLCQRSSKGPKVKRPAELWEDPSRWKGFCVVPCGGGRGSHILQGAMKPHGKHTEGIFLDKMVWHEGALLFPRLGHVYSRPFYKMVTDHQLLIREQIHSRAAEGLTD